MNDRELLELIAAQVAKLTTKVDNLGTDLEELKQEVRKTNIVIEHDVKPKLNALFDGYKQHTDQLGRIEKEVTRHDEFILKRIK